MQEINFENLRSILLGVLEGVDKDTSTKAVGNVLAILMAEQNAPSMRLDMRLDTGCTAVFTSTLEIVRD